VQAYNGTAPYNLFGGQSWGPNVGSSDGYATSEIVIDRQTNSIDFQIHTAFASPDTRFNHAPYNVTVAYADIFINPVFSAAPPSSYSYAISLGDQSANGGLPAGLYLVGSAKTSEDIWGTRTSFVYGGQYAPDGETALAQAAPTVLTGGTLLSDWTVTVAPYSNGILDVSLTTTNAPDLAALFDNFDLLWGTGDCDNAPIFVSVDAPVGEPPGLALLASGLLGLGLLWARRSKRAG